MAKNKNSSNFPEKYNLRILLIFLVLFSAVLFFALQPVTSVQAIGTYQNQVNIPGSTGPTTNFVDYLKQIIGFGYATIGILAMFMLSVGAYQYLMAAGNLSKAESAKNTISSAILGLVLGLMSFVILWTINPDLVSLRGINLAGLQLGSLSTMAPSTLGPNENPNLTTVPALPLNGSIQDRVNSYSSIISKASDATGVPANYIKALIDQESEGNSQAISPKGAQGLMQLMPGTAQGLGVTNSFDPEQNIMGGAKYFGQMLKEFNGNYEQALAAYNWGDGKVKKNGINNLPTETSNFITQVSGKAKSYSSTSSPIM